MIAAPTTPAAPKRATCPDAALEDFVALGAEPEVDVVAGFVDVLKKM